MRVAGRRGGRVNIAGAVCFKSGHRPRMFFELHVHRGRKGEPKTFAWGDYRDFRFRTLTAIPLEAINDVCLRRDDLLQKTGELELQLFHRVGVIVIGRHPVQQFVDLLLQVLDLVYLVRT
ncbi:hypothetical protein GCM10010521_38700 [Streptomyces rameus]|uniref:Uncharacterized protein n=1 Tax=Streptomyces rameus TaxID=68261 RepID=A0ABP6NGH9_9ACTN